MPRPGSTTRIGQTLTATIGTIMDTDGLPIFPGDFTFQWVQVDGTTETDVGTNSQTYVPVAGDVGNTIKVKVTFTDSGGTSEGPLESDETEDAVVAKQENCDTTDRPGNDWCTTMPVTKGSVGGSTITEGTLTDGPAHVALPHALRIACGALPDIHTRRAT